MNPYSSYKWALKRHLPACMLLLIFATIETFASELGKRISGNRAIVPVNDTYQQVTSITQKENSCMIKYTFTGSAQLTDSLYSSLQLIEDKEKTSINPYLMLPPLQKQLEVKIHPQPLSGGEMYLSFNPLLTQKVEIIIQDLLGRTYYNGWHEAENKLSIRFGQQFPALSPGSYQLTVVSKEIIGKKIFFIE